MQGGSSPGQQPFSTVGVLGGGLIGMSWASLFAARGCRVIVVDPRPEAASQMHDFARQAWPHLTALGLTVSDTAPDILVTPAMSALADAKFIQENGPDRLEAKLAMIGALEDVIAPGAVIASSTSSLKASDIQAQARHPDRILVGHPMNPPHMVPMVELVAGRQTSEATMRTAEAFYTAMNRVTIRVKKEVAGHLANRLTAALYREAVHLVAEGIADVDSIDKAIAYGPGMRWALIGPHLTYHMGGGAGGYRHYLDHLGPTQEARWRELGEAPLTEDLKAQLVAGLAKELEGQDQATLTQRRDAALVELAQIKAKYGF